MLVESCLPIVVCIISTFLHCITYSLCLYIKLRAGYR